MLSDSLKKELEKALEGNSGKDDLINKIAKNINDSVESGRTDAATEAKRKANSEAKNVRERFKKKWEKLGLDPDSDEFDSSLDNVLASIDKGKTAGKSENDEISRLTMMVEELKETAANEKKARKESQLKAKRREVESEIINVLTEKKAIKPKILLSSLMPNVIIDEDDATPAIFKSGDKELSITDGVANFIEANPEFIENRGNPGGNSGGDKGGQGSPNKDTDLNTRRQQLRELNSSHV